MKWNSACAVVLVGGLGAAASFAMPAAQTQPRSRAQLGDPLILRGPGSFIGVTVREVGPSDGTSQPPGGVVIEDVSPDTPAARAGFKAADVVATFDGERVRSVQQFSRLVQETAPGRTVTAAVLRDGKRMELQVTPEQGRAGPAMIDRERMRADIERALEAVPPFTVDIPGLFDRSRAALGVTVQELTPGLAEYFGVKDGVLVASVADDSPASRAGLRAGDVITRAGNASVATRADLLRAVRDAEAGQDLPLGITRDKKESTVTVRVEPGSERPRRLRMLRGTGV
jgi:serine protease Do